MVNNESIQVVLCDIKTNENKEYNTQTTFKEYNNFYDETDRKTRSSRIKKICNALNIYINNNYFIIYDAYFHLYGIMMFEIFFYLYFVIRIEKDKVLYLIKAFANYLMTLLRSKMNIPQINRLINTIANDPVCDSLTNNFETVQNADVIQSCFHYIYFLNIILFALTVVHYFIYRSFKKILKSFGYAVLFIVFCAIFEYFFFIFIVMNFKIISKEETTCYFLEEIKKSNK